MKQYTFVLNFGYVESSGLSYLPFTSGIKHVSAKAALIDLAQFLKEQYLFQYCNDFKKCCLTSKKIDVTAEFCSKCGHSLVEEEFDSEHFEGWLRDMDGVDIDTFHGNFMEYDETYRWQSNGLEDAPNQRFVYQAEWVLSAALGYPHREDQTFEDICKDRTKSKRESFAYI